jgi:hypothetical protein
VEIEAAKTTMVASRDGPAQQGESQAQDGQTRRPVADLATQMEVARQVETMAEPREVVPGVVADSVEMLSTIVAKRS